MRSSVAKETLSAFLHFSEKDTKSDEDRGTEDGSREYPASGELDFSSHEKLRISQAQSALNRYARRLREEQDVIDDEVKSRTLERDHHSRTQKAAYVSKKQAELDNLKSTIGYASPKYKELKTRYEGFKREYQHREFIAGRAVEVALANPLFWVVTPYILILSVLTVLEVPINRLAIQSAFDFGGIESLFISFFVGLVFVLMAHFTGLLIRRSVGKKIAKEGGKAGRWATITVILVAAALLMIVLFNMRGQVAETLAANQQGITLEALGNIGGSPLPDGGPIDLGAEGGVSPQGQAGSAAETALTTGFFDALGFLFTGSANPTEADIRYAQFGMLLLNLMVFALGSILSFFRHDPDPGLERAAMDKESAERKLNKFVSKYENTFAGVEKEFTEQINLIENSAARIDEEIETLKEERQQLDDQSLNDMRLVVTALEEQIAAYQRGNQNARRTKAPPYFGVKRPLEAGMPEDQPRFGEIGR
ncbi:MAG: hypothetical protein ACPGOV_02395 [Magnetovibrionaceae bacterium]